MNMNGFYTKEKREDKRVNFSCRNARKGKEERTLKKKKMLRFNDRITLPQLSTKFSLFFFLPSPNETKRKETSFFRECQRKWRPKKDENRINASHQYLSSGNDAGGDEE